MNRPFLKGMSAYRDVDIQTRSTTHDQHELVSMMFEGTLESVVRAKGAIQQGDTATKVAEIGRAVRIIQEGLRTSLDLENGGELAANLANLYDYCVMRLTQANAASDTTLLDEVASLIKPVAEAWRQMRTGADTKAPDTPAELHAPATAPKVPPVARRMGSLYGQGMALSGA